MKFNHPKQAGTHTWDLTVHYHQCPSCKAIIESRDDYVYRLGSYIKEIECPYCEHAFTLKKRIKHKIGPFFGEGDTAEIEWRD